MDTKNGFWGLTLKRSLRNRCTYREDRYSREEDMLKRGAGDRVSDTVLRTCTEER